MIAVFSDINPFLYSIPNYKYTNLLTKLNIRSLICYLCVDIWILRTFRD